jgi:multiple sugar transport system permease protein/putative aldouronate transport system permease protein
LSQPWLRRRRRHRRRIVEPRIDRAFGVVNYGILGLFALSVLYPLVYVASLSLSSPTARRTGQVRLWPVDLTLDAYRAVLHTPPVLTGLDNSIVYAAGGAVIGTVLTVLASYPLSRPDLVGRRFLTVVLLIPMLFPAGIIPTYIVVRELHLLNSRWAVVLPVAMSVFNVIVTCTFFKVMIPMELLEAARVDGADDFRFVWRVVLPLSKPILAVNLLFYAVAQWNSWFPAFIYLNQPHLYPLQLLLRNGYARQYAVVVLAMLPPLLVFPFAQRYLVRGVLLGSMR